MRRRNRSRTRNRRTANRRTRSAFATSDTALISRKTSRKFRRRARNFSYANGRPTTPAQTPKTNTSRIAGSKNNANKTTGTANSNANGKLAKTGTTADSSLAHSNTANKNATRGNTTAKRRSRNRARSARRNFNAETPKPNRCPTQLPNSSLFGTNQSCQNLRQKCGTNQTCLKQPRNQNLLDFESCYAHRSKRSCDLRTEKCPFGSLTRTSW